MPEPDDFDRQLRDLTSGQAEPARFTELSAAERARRKPSPPPPPAKLPWRKARKARQLRRPVGDTGGKRAAGGGKRKLSAVGSSRRPSASRRKQRLLSALRLVGVLIAFLALLYGLHLLGLGPQ